MAETGGVSTAGGQSGIGAAKAGGLATGLVDGMVRRKKGLPQSRRTQSRTVKIDGCFGFERAEATSVLIERTSIALQRVCAKSSARR